MSCLSLLGIRAANTLTLNVLAAVGVGASFRACEFVRACSRGEDACGEGDGAVKVKVKVHAVKVHVKVLTMGLLELFPLSSQPCPLGVVSSLRLHPAGVVVG